MSIHLTKAEAYTLIGGSFPEKIHYPSVEEEKAFKPIVIVGHYCSNRFPGGKKTYAPNQPYEEIIKKRHQERTIFIEEAKSLETDYFFLYEQQYHVVKVKDFVVLDSSFDNTPFVSYMMLAQCHPDVIDLFRDSDLCSLIGLSTDPNFTSGKEHLMTRKGIYFFKKIFKEYAQFRWNDTSWKWQVDMSKVLQVI